MKHIMTGNAARMLAMAKVGFLLLSRAQRPVPPSKHRPLGDKETGSAAATSYRLKKRISAAHSSSLRKLDREARIHNKLRPRTYDVPGRREATILKRANLASA